MKVVIAGAGSVGRSIARDMVKRAHEVVIIDRSPSAMRVAAVPDADWILGDACEISTLEQAQMDNVDVVVTATGDDKANLVVSLLAKTEYGVPRVISRINNPANEWLFNETWGVDVPVSTPNIMSNLIEDAVASGSFVRKMTLTDDGAVLYQGRVAKGARVVGQVVGDIILPPDITISAVIRDNIALVAAPDLVIDEKDYLLVIAQAGSEVHLGRANMLISPPGVGHLSN
ncbi:MAG: TrkA family potassium uptake protein [Actinomycetaceae bacterium]|nr:TrkA family potassium uptake protein [Actinomycetaceae bacterium]